MNFSFLKFRAVAALVLSGIALLIINLNFHDYGDTTCRFGISGKTSECVLLHNGNSGLALGTDPIRFLFGGVAVSVFVLAIVSILSLMKGLPSTLFSKFRCRFLKWLSLVYRVSAA